MATYEVSGFRMYSIDDEGERSMLCNFEPVITEEVRYVDGATVSTVLTIVGKMLNRDGEEIDLPEVKVDTSDFAGMQWVMPSWGVRCVISPGGSVKEAIRTAVQLNSNPKVVTVYKAIGWTQTEKGRAYIHAGGGITAKGNDPTMRVQLPQELSKYNLATTADPAQAVQAVLRLANIATPEVGWTLLAATYAPLLGPVDFGIHVTGRTGSFKSEVISLFQSCYGAGMDARHLPGSWSSTANALEAQAFYAANAPFVIDDFVPSGTSWQVRSYQQTADKIMRAQGNQSGRARLTDTSNLQSTMYPRGVILSTGEDTPEGHSVRARMMILELSPGDVDTKVLTTAQKARPLYTACTAAFIQWLAENPVNIEDDVEAIRGESLDIGHTRTPSMIGRLLATVKVFTEWMIVAGYITESDAMAGRRQAEDAIMSAAREQQSYLQSADPCDLFTAAIRHIFGAGLAHVRTLNGGIPRAPTTLGWVGEGEMTGDIPTFKSRGPCIGWVDWNTNSLYIDVVTGFNTIKKAAGNELSLTKQTLLKRLKDGGFITRSDDTRQRNTIRITAENHPRQVMCLDMQQVLDSQEVPSDE